MTINFLYYKSDFPLFNFYLVYDEIMTVLLNGHLKNENKLLKIRIFEQSSLLECWCDFFVFSEVFF